MQSQMLHCSGIWSRSLPNTPPRLQLFSQMVPKDSEVRHLARVLFKKSFSPDNSSCMSVECILTTCRRIFCQEQRSEAKRVSQIASDASRLTLVLSGYLQRTVNHPNICSTLILTYHLSSEWGCDVSDLCFIARTRVTMLSVGMKIVLLFLMRVQYMSDSWPGLDRLVFSYVIRSLTKIVVWTLYRELIISPKQIPKVHH